MDRQRCRRLSSSRSSDPTPVCLPYRSDVPGRPAAALEPEPPGLTTVPATATPPNHIGTSALILGSAKATPYPRPWPYKSRHRRSHHQRGFVWRSRSEAAVADTADADDVDFAGSLEQLRQLGSLPSSSAGATVVLLDMSTKVPAARTTTSGNCPRWCWRRRGRCWP